MVVVCKARLPSILLGLLIKHACGCPVLLDVDDHELAFFDNREAIPVLDLPRYADEADLEVPFGETWTRVAESLISTFDGLMVSNIELQRRFGGSIIRHARDERYFFENSDVREMVRKEFGFSPTDEFILFLGTPRAHKGVFQIADALERLAAPNLALCIIGNSNDKRVDAVLAKYKRARIFAFPDQPFVRLPQLLNMADGICLLQDPASAIAKYQIPAKLTDALSVGVPVAITDVAPMRDLPTPSVVSVIRNDEELRAFLTSIAGDELNSANQKLIRRNYFAEEYSYGVNINRLENLFVTASKNNSTWHDDWSNLFNSINSLYMGALPNQPPPRGGTRSAAPAVVGRAKFDIAFFWKQNDTGIYGRRHDMIIKYLSRHERVGKIIQFDAPVDVRQIRSSVRLDDDAFLDQSNLVCRNIIERYLGVANSENIVRKVYVHKGQRAGDESFLGHLLPPQDEYPAWVRQTLIDHRLQNSMFSWVAPVVFDYPMIHDIVTFDLTIADIIDDQRTMLGKPEHLARIRQSYSDTLERVDVVFANCDAVREVFAPYRDDIVVVPNGAERTARVLREKPGDLANLRGPIIGYVGNLRDRIDVDLIEFVTECRPDWQIVLIGSAHRSPEVLRLRRRRNVHFLGVKIYEDALRYIQHFDVAIMPHLDNEVSKMMNPLKLYVYVAAGVPVVTTAVANIDDVAHMVTVTNNYEEFLRGIERKLRSKSLMRSILDGLFNAWSGNASYLPHSLTWDKHIQSIIQRIDDF